MTKINKVTSENKFTEITALDGSDFLKEKIVINGAYTLLMQLKNKSEEE